MSEAALIVDLKGLAKKVANRPKSFILCELLQNAWDEDIKKVTVTARMLPGRPACEIVVQDDSPEGFADIRSIYTMFRDSKKANDPSKRGRFEMGEKLVLALATEATISTTKGTIIFCDGQRVNSRKCREKGSVFTGVFKMTREDFEEMLSDVKLLSVPEHIETMFNGEFLIPRHPRATFSAALQTIRANEEGVLVPTQRKTDIKVYPVRDGEVAHLYEMGIPVVPTGDKWHYDVQQRVPVNWERNNVPPAYLRTLRVEALNALHEDLSSEDSRAPWVTDAMDDGRIAPEAVKDILVYRFGPKAVVNDPSDPEGTKIAITQGYTVIPGGAFSKAAWENIRTSEAVLPAGQVTPSPKPYSPEGRGEHVIHEAEWSWDMRRIADLGRSLFRYVFREELSEVVIVKEPNVYWAANYGPGRLCLNYGKLGKEWFARENSDTEVLDLLIHEFVHHTVKDHLSAEMHERATWIGARLVKLALEKPEIFLRQS